MRCHKCGFHSFDYLSECNKCGSDLSSIRDSLGLLSVKPDIPFFLNVLLRGPGAGAGVHEVGVLPGCRRPVGSSSPRRLSSRQEDSAAMQVDVAAAEATPDEDPRPLKGKIMGSAFLRDFRRLAQWTTRGCIVLERPDLLKELVERHDQGPQPLPLRALADHPQTFLARGIARGQIQGLVRVGRDCFQFLVVYQDDMRTRHESPRTRIRHQFAAVDIFRHAPVLRVRHGARGLAVTRTGSLAGVTVSAAPDEGRSCSGSGWCGIDVQGCAQVATCGGDGQQVMAFSVAFTIQARTQFFQQHGEVLAIIRAVADVGIAAVSYTHLTLPTIYPV